MGGVCEHGVDPTRWGGRSSVQDPSFPTFCARELSPIFPLLPAIRLPNAAQNGEFACRVCFISLPQG